MKAISYIVVILISLNCFSQVPITGKIIDKDNNPVAFASLYLPGSKKGTVSNEDGDFYIIINPEVDKELLVSHLSYIDAKVTIKTGSPLTIQLNQKENMLEEVVVGNQLTGYDIALKVAENLKKNHGVEPAHYEYFSRIVYYSNDWKKVNLVQEFYGKLKHNSNHNTRANVKKSRGVYYNPAGKEQLHTESTIDLWAIRADNLLLYKPEFLKKGKLKRYNISLEGSTTINGIDCYILKYTNEKEKYVSDTKAIAYIDKETYGLVKLITGNYGTEAGTYHERNFTRINNQWILSSATDKHHRNKITTTLYTYLNNSKDYVNEDFPPTPFNDRLESFNKNLNDSFWDNYNHIPLPEN